MAITDRYLHSLTIYRNVPGAVDDYGQPTGTPTTVAMVNGLIQPRDIREVNLASQTGAVIGDHVGYMAPLATLGTDCWIVDDHFPGVRFDVVSLPDAAGLGHHLEIGLESVT